MARTARRSSKGSKKASKSKVSKRRSAGNGDEGFAETSAPTPKEKPLSYLPKIKVVGVGGGGGNAVSRMFDDFVRGVEFWAINTDEQDLNQNNVRRKLYIGKNVTRGLGAGMNPEVGRQAAEESRQEITEALQGADLVFVTAGLGGGTGTGGAPVVAEIAKHSGALTIAVVTKPFGFEGTQRNRLAEEGLAKLKDKVDALIVIPNDRIFTVIAKDTSIMKAFQAIDDILRNALRGIVEILTTPGIINVDFADVRTVMSDAGSAIVGIGIASGQDRAIQAMTKALTSPLLEVNAEGATGVLLGVSGGRDMKMTEINEAAKMVAQTVDADARIIFGSYYDRKLKPNQIKVTVIATGFRGPQAAPSLFSNADYSGNVPRTFRGEYESLSGVVSGRDYGDIPAPASRVLEEEPASPRENDQPLSDEAPKDTWDVPAFLRKKRKR
jgi:cell division protein FtsZ